MHKPTTATTAAAGSFLVGDGVLERSRERFSDQNEKSGLLLKRTEPMAPVLLAFFLQAKVEEEKEKVWVFSAFWIDEKLIMCE